MKTAGAKRKSRVGRKPEEGVPRHACGKKRQPTPEQIANMNRAAVIAQRVRHYGLRDDQASDQASASSIGRLHLSGEISVDQYLAAQKVAEAHHNAGMAIQRPTVRSGSDFGGVRGHDGSDGTDEAHVEWVARVMQRWRDIRSAILSSGSLGMMAVQAVVIEDKPAGLMIGDLRAALNAVHRLHGSGRG